jgi:hypothetical protein
MRVQPGRRDGASNDKLGVGWVVSPEIFNGKIVLELTEKDDERAAGRFVTKLPGDLGLT